MSTHHTRTASVAITLVLVTWLAVGCGQFGSADTPPTIPPEQLPCDPPISQANNLRAPRGEPPAEFTTDGSGLYVTVSGFEHGLPFDPNVGSSAIYIGEVETTPTYDRQTDVVTHTLLQLSTEENQPAELELPAGRYWLWASNAPDLRLWGCSEGSVTDAVSGGN